MRKNRKFVDGAFYHVTSRTNDKIRVFENNLGRKIMLITLHDAKDKFNFCLTNFCIMPTHIHLLIKPKPDTGLSDIMHWIKIISAKRWNFIHGSTDHLWGKRYFARAIKDKEEYEAIMKYIDQNPVVVGLAASPEEWKASAAFYKKNGVSGLVDLSLIDSPKEFLFLPSIPYSVSKLIPLAQLEYVQHYIGAYAVSLDRLYRLLSRIPNISDIEVNSKPKTYLHYYTKTHDYFIAGYDGDNIMYGNVCTNVYPIETQYKKFNLSELMKNEFLRLEFPSIR